MSLGKSTVIFKEFNGNTSKCSAWLQEKDRCCERTIVAADQERKEMLIQSIARSRTYHDDKSNELAGLYFCNGWHRPGGRYAISSSQTRKLLQNLFPSIPEPGTRYPPAARPSESPVSSLTSGTRESALIHPLDGARLPLSTAQPAVQSSWHGVSEFSEAERFSFSAAQPTPSELSEAEMLSLSIAQLGVQPNGHEAFELSEEERLSFTTAQPPSQHNISELSEVERLSFSIANLTVQSPQLNMSTFSVPQQVRQRTTSPAPNLEISLPVSLDQWTSSAVQLQQNAQSEPTQSGQPLCPSSVEENRMDRSVQSDENCLICLEALASSIEVTRCKFCHIYLHLDCMLEWLTASGSSTTCIHCHHNFEDDDITALIESVGDSIEKERFQRQHRLKIQENRRDRPVDVDEECPICFLAFEDPSEVARCRVCDNDLHLNCLHTWLTIPGNDERCPLCRCGVGDDDVNGLIELVRGPSGV